jgi:predicted alpha/beta-hydrolase family hydrolase
MSGLQPGRSAVLAPGGNNSAEVPLLMYAGLAARRRGAFVRVIRWELVAGRGIGQQREMVVSKVAEAVDELTSASGAGPLVIGKSLGSLAAQVVADRGLAAVWFTPLLTDEPTVTALRRATGPSLLAGGTADQFWDGPVARSVTGDVVEVDGADHAMFVPGPLAACTAVLGEVLTAVESFLDHAVWP